MLAWLRGGIGQQWQHIIGGLAPLPPTAHLPSSMLQFPYFSQPGAQFLRSGTATGAMRLAVLLWGVVSQTHADNPQSTKRTDNAQFLVAFGVQYFGFKVLVLNGSCIAFLSGSWRPRPAAKQMAVWRMPASMPPRAHELLLDTDMLC
jgi:hypothetical protein